ncbi:hypothetical protein BV898_18859 [Hypsibius exemplaris]|uniref:Uncharacterized protein n=1 Tax=Hypsibius exemplaris TaxID=2072580 RepID=A0A9X6RNY0_HYPEX|nr:hypothetical protein BV898_18859 [Hypsibius exemplaris]
MCHCGTAIAFVTSHHDYGMSVKRKSIAVAVAAAFFICVTIYNVHDRLLVTMINLTTESKSLIPHQKSLGPVWPPTYPLSTRIKLGLIQFLQSLPQNNFVSAIQRSTPSKNPYLMHSVSQGDVYDLGRVLAITGSQRARAITGCHHRSHAGTRKRSGDDDITPLYDLLHRLFSSLTGIPTSAAQNNCNPANSSRAASSGSAWKPYRPDETLRYSAGRRRLPRDGTSALRALLNNPREHACRVKQVISGVWSEESTLDGGYWVCLDNLRIAAAKGTCLVYEFGVRADCDRPGTGFHNYRHRHQHQQGGEGLEDGDVRGDSAGIWVTPDARLTSSRWTRGRGMVLPQLDLHDPTSA